MRSFRWRTEAKGRPQSLVDATGGRLEARRVQGPLGGEARARFGVLGGGDTAVIEMAEASGLALIPPNERDPLRASTYGTGELIRAALDLGVRKLIVGIGGSATNDGGAGMAQALGARLLDAEGQEIPRGGGFLNRLDRIDMERNGRSIEKCRNGRGVRPSTTRSQDREGLQPSMDRRRAPRRNR